jgi:cysteine synthase
VGTGGTISGVAKYLKEKNPNIKIWGIDTYGSVLKNTTKPEFSTKMKSIHTSPKELEKTFFLKMLTFL